MKLKRAANRSSFKPGQSGNPKGRPKGSRNKLAEDFVATLADDFQKHGKKAVETVRRERPADYLRVCAMLMPKDIHVQHTVLDDLQAMTDQELRDLSERLARELAAGAGSSAGPARTH